ncbi:Uu.00g020930.m01.CDS01 [Anthostomella pinea]|uniref:Uu.00g020930.m01.CDS01 n=1 Tax=Anthostomella pinea TaxID=933095 RepID=A0AAI8VZJ7_9PEZI|nr:Uu.00g020930.m01.CDS01 [Anthostomella pinea]
MDPEKTLGVVISATTVPASSLTPEPPTTQQHGPPQPQSKDNVNIEISPASYADDARFVQALTDVVNVVYLEAEAGIFNEGYQRTTASGIADLLRAGQLAVAFLSEPKTSTSPITPNSESGSDDSRRPIGCVCIKRLSDTHGEFGMLALAASHRGGGLGRDLAQFAEARCRGLGLKVMRLELLVPTFYENASKVRIQGWYERMGYRVVRLQDFGEEYPHLAGFLAGPTEYRVFEKSLV